MLAYLCEKYPDIEKHVVFADTGWEHTDATEWCNKIADHFGLTLHLVRNKNKTFFQMVSHRRMFPGMQLRQCTSDLKRGPIQTWTRNNIKDPLIINCMGMRSEESIGRSKMKRLKRNKTMTNRKRTVWDWLPIKDWSEQQVLQYLSDKQIPLHPAYQYLRRFSCRVCIFMTKHDLRAVAKHDPDAIKIISRIESEIGFNMFSSGPIESIINNRTK